MVSKIISFSILTLIVSIVLINYFSRVKPNHPLADLNVQEIIQEYNYPVEVHNVVTEDGYILTLHRIPHGRGNHSRKRKPILLLHGLLQSAWDFVHLGPNQSLAFVLSEEGYDVWLGSVRGTTWSRNHTTLDPDKDAAFWDYTIHEIGVYDLPAFIDYVLEKTEQKSIHYLGYSQGTIAFFIMGSEKTDYLSKIKFMAAFSPAFFLRDPISPIVKFLANNWRSLQGLLNFFNYRELFGRGDLFSSYMKFVCHDENSVLINLCIHTHFSIFGYSYDELNKSMLPLTAANTPCGVSLKQFVHVFQIADSGDFHRYDFGNQGNLEKYGQEQPPHYDVSRVTTPVAIYYSSNDWAVNINNMDRVLKTVPNVVKSYKVPLEDFNHLDFLYAKHVGDLLFNVLLDDLSKY
ncbi:lipase 1-like [Zophobas morio]|uniref:lipase 1-like n=1 Tax=Zophobas morio TaxID=2755281 RepID=UPI003083D2E3